MSTAHPYKFVMLAFLYILELCIHLEKKNENRRLHSTINTKKPSLFDR